LGRRNSSGVNVARGEGRAGNSVGRKGVQVQVAPACRFSEVAEGNIRRDLLRVRGAREELSNSLRFGAGNRLFPETDAAAVHKVDVGRGIGVRRNGWSAVLRVLCNEGFGFFAGCKGLGPVG
jgi:hypothetical protein